MNIQNLFFLKNKTIYGKKMPPTQKNPPPQKKKGITFSKKESAITKKTKLDSPKLFHIYLYIYLSVRNDFEELNQYL